MSQEMKSAYDVLDINTKRNQLSDELIIMYELIKKFEFLKGVTPMTKVKNYDAVSDEFLDESQMLTFFYEDVYNIQQELITLLNLIDFNK